MHYALLYREPDEYLCATSAFLTEGAERGDSLMVAIPGHKVEPLRETLNGTAEQVRFVDMTVLGRNPNRIIPEVRDWVARQDGRRCRFIGEPIWAGRTERETIEATRHEALINLAFADAPATILCPYDASSLDEHVLFDAERTHPLMLDGARSWESPRYADPHELWLAAEWSLPEPSAPLIATRLGLDLGEVRRITETCARRAGLSELGVQDAVLVVDEAATNALQHARPPARLRIWQEDGTLVCEIADHGSLEDPLAGRRRPDPEWIAGRGLWLINQLCDLVELRPLALGTSIRMHLARNR